MDILDIRNSRNGVESEYFNFVPIVVAVGGGAAINSLLKKKKNKKYANSQVAYLQGKFPAQSSSQSQLQSLESMKQERAQLEKERASAKSKTTKQSLDIRINAFNEYIADSTTTYNELVALEQTPSPQVVETPPSVSTTQVSPTQTTPKDSVLGSAPVGNEGTTQVATTPSTSALQSLVSGVTPSANGNKTWLYVGIGVVVVGVFILMRKK